MEGDSGPSTSGTGPVAYNDDDDDEVHPAEEDNQTKPSWIYTLEERDHMNAGDIQEWIDEGDTHSLLTDWVALTGVIGNCVQWFRCKAEIQWWQEAHEQKQSELLRCMRSFTAESIAWKQ